MSRVQDVFGGSPKTVLNKPFMHVQNRQAQNTARGSSSAGANDRSFNTTLVNEIPGAVVSDPYISLPAGVYYVEGMVPGQDTEMYRAEVHDDGGTQLLIGPNRYIAGASHSSSAKVAGQITLSSTANIKLVSRHGKALAASGLGTPFNQPVEVYEDFRIWKLDEAIETVVKQNPLYKEIRPLMHVQYQENIGVVGDTVPSGLGRRPLNTTLINEISGASLSSEVITLPAGEYEIDATTVLRAGAADAARYTSTGIKRDSDDVTLLRGLNAGPRNAHEMHHAITSGRFTLSVETDVYLYTYTTAASQTIAACSETGSNEVYADVRIWRVDALKTIESYGDSELTLARPFMHVQDQKTNGTSGGASVTSSQLRDLNTVLTNEISGASLSSDEITLPAGEYYIEAYSQCYNTSGNRLLIEDTSSTQLLLGTSIYAHPTGVARSVPVSGRVTLASTTVIRVRHYTQAVSANGLGVPEASTLSDDEVYTDIKIWQIDAVTQTPVLINDKLYPLPGNTIVTGNMHGLEYAYNGTSSVTVQPGICMDSLNKEILCLPSAVNVTIGTTINEIYNLFICKTSAGAVSVQTDTDVNGANLTGTYDYFRWIGFVATNSSGNVYEFNTKEDYVSYPLSTSAPSLGTVSGTTTFDISTVLPAGRIAMLLPASIGQNTGKLTHWYNTSDATDKLSYQNSYYGFSTLWLVPDDDKIKVLASGWTPVVYVAGVKLRR